MSLGSMLMEERKVNHQHFLSDQKNLKVTNGNISYQLILIKHIKRLCYTIRKDTSSYTITTNEAYAI